MKALKGLLLLLALGLVLAGCPRRYGYSTYSQLDVAPASDVIVNAG
jgi:hypothetical protein